MSDIVNLKEISERFNNGTETIEDIINYCRNYEITFENDITIRIVEKKYFDKLVKRIKELEEENKKYIVQLTDEQYRNLVDTIKKEAKQEFKQKVKESYLNMEKEYTRKVYDNNYNRNEVKKEEFYKRQVYEELLEDK